MTAMLGVFKDHTVTTMQQMMKIQVRGYTHASSQGIAVCLLVEVCQCYWY